jgi:DNA-nicking Smr family endonuclease
MRPPRRPRGLSGEDARLWSAVAQLITPMRGRASPQPEAELEPPAAKTVPSSSPAPPAPKPPRRRVTVKPSPPPAPPTPVVAPPPPSPGLERRVRIALRRGALRVDARLDLHGMYQAEAHGALTHFLMRCRAAGHTHVLVVTGKGGAGADDPFSERGVLRRSVPHWLRAPELRSVVLGFEEAARHHGGAGALYVRLRRR